MHSLGKFKEGFGLLWRFNPSITEKKEMRLLVRRVICNVPTRCFAVAFSTLPTPGGDLPRSSKTLFEFSEAGSRIRLLSSCAAIHGMYWVGHSVLLLSGALDFDKGVVPGFTAPPEVLALGYFDVGSPVFACGGMVGLIITSRIDITVAMVYTS